MRIPKLTDLIHSPRFDLDRNRGAERRRARERVAAARRVAVDTAVRRPLPLAWAAAQAWWTALRRGPGDRRGGRVSSGVHPGGKNQLPEHQRLAPFHSLGRGEPGRPARDSLALRRFAAVVVNRENG